MQTTIFKSLTIIFTLSVLSFISGCSDEQKQAAKNTADTVVKQTDKAIEITKEASSEAWNVTKDATESAADTVADKTSEVVEVTKDVSSEAWSASKDAAKSATDTVENTTNETLDSAKQAVQ